MAVRTQPSNHKVGLLNLAEELGNVSKACQIMGLSPHTFYRYRDAVEDGGVKALLERPRRAPMLSRIIMFAFVDTEFHTINKGRLPGIIAPNDDVDRLKGREPAAFLAKAFEMANSQPDIRQRVIFAHRPMTLDLQDVANLS